MFSDLKYENTVGLKISLLLSTPTPISYLPVKLLLSLLEGLGSSMGQMLAGKGKGESCCCGERDVRLGSLRCRS